MVYKTEFNADSFPWWSYAKTVYRNIALAKKVDEFNALIEERFDGEVPSKTAINDYVWFNYSEIYACLGLDEDGNLIERK